MPSARRKAYAGVYYSDDVGAALELRWTGSGLRLVQDASVAAREVEWVVGDRFRSGSWTLDFELEQGRPVAFRLDAGRVKNLRYARVPD
jgi:hypothetical protein